MDTEVFLLLHGTSGIQGYQEVIPGVYCGTSEGLDPVAEFAKRGNRSLPQGFRFFFGYSGWGTDQLKKEIAAGLWCVAACSSDLITSTSTSGLWEGVLQLMGGKYLELSKRPRRKQY
jgi:putative transcriptional regulator